MKKSLSVMLAMVFLLSGAGLVMAGTHQQGNTDQQMQSSQEEDGWFCPVCGSQGYGGKHSGMMGMGSQSGMGSGKMNYGWNRSGCPRDKAKNLAPIEKDEAKMLMKNYVAANPNLKIGKITEVDGFFVGEVVTKDGSLVEKLKVNKKTGWMKRDY